MKKMDDVHISLETVLKTTTHFMAHVQRRVASYDNLRSCAFCLSLIYHLHNDKIEYDDETEEEKDLIEKYGTLAGCFLNMLEAANKNPSGSGERAKTYKLIIGFLVDFHRQCMKLDHIRAQYVVIEDTTPEEVFKHRQAVDVESLIERRGRRA